MPDALKTSRLDDALYLRGLIMPLIAGRLERTESNIGPMLAARIGPFTFIYTTPFQKEALNRMWQLCAQAGAPGRSWPKPYALDAWYLGKKVLAMDWEDGLPPRLLSFRRGEWREALVELVEASQRHGVPSLRICERSDRPLECFQ
jgi:hypothetical protein